MLTKVKTNEPVWFNDTSCNVDEFRAHQNQQTDPCALSACDTDCKQVPVYDGAALLTALNDETQWQAVMAEWNRSLRTGPGIIVVQGGMNDFGLIDAATKALESIIREEEASSSGKGDHFASAGANSRVWNAHEKLCMQDTETYIRYNGNELVRRISEAWLGPAYQLTTQVNVVRPGGKAQVVHRDYHMGFQTTDQLNVIPHASTHCPHN